VYIGKEYFIDPVTKESQWEHPNTTNSKPSSSRKAANGDQVQVLHILVKHTGSRNPKNYKGETITRSKEEARNRLNGSYSNTFIYLLIGLFIEIMNDLENGDDLESTFRRIAKDKSDCSSGQRGGNFVF
jgi:NIMA-interacting peptidyl-prolyl cis-trans isomerase 1